MVAREGFRYVALLQQRHTKYGRIRGMVVGEGGRSTGVLLKQTYTANLNNIYPANGEKNTCRTRGVKTCTTLP